MYMELRTSWGRSDGQVMAIL